MIAIDPAGFEKRWSYKYVRFASGIVLFCDAADMNASHKQLAQEYAEGGNPAPPVSAGIIKVAHRRWAISESGSVTLKLGRLESDEKYIQKALGSGYRHDVEVLYEGLGNMDVDPRLFGG